MSSEWWIVLSSSQKVKRAKQKMASAKKGKMIVVAGRKSSTPGDSPSTIGSIKRKPKKKPLVEPAPQGVNEPSVIKHTVPASASITTGTTDENNQTSKDDVVLGSDVPVASPSGPTDSPSKLSLPPVMSALSPNSSENEGEGNPLEGIKGLPPPLPPDLPKELLMKIDEMKQVNRNFIVQCCCRWNTTHCAFYHLLHMHSTGQKFHTYIHIYYVRANMYVHTYVCNYVVLSIVMALYVVCIHMYECTYVCTYEY